MSFVYYYVNYFFKTYYISYITYFTLNEIIDIMAIIDIILLHVALHVALCLEPHWLSLHIAGPSQCPRVDKPHPASVPRTRPAVAGRI